MIGVRAQAIWLGEKLVLRNLNFSAGAGELVALVGPNGAGKTSLLRALAGTLMGFAPADPRRVAYVPQGVRCSWSMRVEDVVALGRIPHGDAAGPPIEAAIAICRLAALRKRPIDQISGGEARRAMLARALATEPSVLLLDEPTADLDPAAAHEMMQVLRDFVAPGRCAVVVLHALELALHHASRLVVMNEGQVIADGPPAATLPQAAAAFGLDYGMSPTPGLLPPPMRGESMVTGGGTERKDVSLRPE
jgi:iron complex transport system ATP-binding protein